MPWPKPTCGFGSRVMSNSSARAKTALVAVRRPLPHDHLVARCDRCAARARSRASPCGASMATVWSSARSPRPRWAAAPGRRATAVAGRDARAARASRRRSRCGWSRAGDEEQREEHVELAVGEARRICVVERGVHDDRQHVVARVAALLGDELGAVCVHARPRRRGVEVGLERLARTTEVEARLDGLEEPVTFGLGHAEQDADRLHRELGRDLEDEVERLRLVDGVEQRPGASAQLVLDAADHPRGEARAHEAADTRVARVVHHVEDLARRPGRSWRSVPP